MDVCRAFSGFLCAFLQVLKSMGVSLLEAQVTNTWDTRCNEVVSVYVRLFGGAFCAQHTRRLPGCGLGSMRSTSFGYVHVMSKRFK